MSTRNSTRTFDDCDSMFTLFVNSAIKIEPLACIFSPTFKPVTAKKNLSIHGAQSEPLFLRVELSNPYGEELGT